MDYGDLILGPFYILLLYFFFRAKRKKYEDPLIQKYHRQGFWIKIIGCIAFIIYNTYLSPGDSIYLYQKEGKAIYHLILNNSDNLKWLFKTGRAFDISLLSDRSNAGYFHSEANFLTIKLVTVFSFFTAAKYAATNLIFAAIAFSGVWKLFLFFYRQYPAKHKKFAIAILYFPTFVFWSSGILKDTICIAALGWITYAGYDLFYNKKSLIKNLIYIFVFGYLLAVLKVYILLAYAPFFILFIILKNVQGVRVRILRFFLAPFLIALSVFAFTNILTSYNDELGVYGIDDVTSSISSLNAAFEQKNGDEDAASNFKLGVNYDGSFTSLLKCAPVAIATTFFRPFIWEAHKISQLLAALESLVLMYFTLYIIFKSGLFGFVRIILTDPLIMYCFLFSLVFAMFVGVSTLNFGTLVRYKIPCLPFYAISLFLIYEKVKEKSLRKSLQKASTQKLNTLIPAVS
jgi:hypothetical protein